MTSFVGSSLIVQISLGRFDASRFFCSLFFVPFALRISGQVTPHLFLLDFFFGPLLPEA